MNRVVLLLLLGACGARTMLGAPETDASVIKDAGVDAQEERSCLVECTFGHQCCAGSCSGPAVPMSSDCCTCLPGEVNSETCGSEDQCGR